MPESKPAPPVSTLHLTPCTERPTPLRSPPAKKSANHLPAAEFSDRGRIQPREPMTDELSFLLDRKTKALRSGEKWVISYLQPDGSFDMVAHWVGGPRSLVRWCAEHDVHPSREAEAIISSLPEGGFKDRG